MTTTDRSHLDCSDCAFHGVPPTNPRTCRECVVEGERTGVWLPMFVQKTSTDMNEAQIALTPFPPIYADGLGQNVTNPALDQKASNPKDAVGSSKLPLDLVPDTLPVYAAMSFAEGASKYGAYNWRVAGVRASIYKAALERHLKKWWNGEECDPATKVPHLASVIACAAIILDAEACGKLNDDRPPHMVLADVIAKGEEVVAHVRKLNAAANPTHCTQKALEAA